MSQTPEQTPEQDVDPATANATTEATEDSAEDTAQDSTEASSGPSADASVEDGDTGDDDDADDTDDDSDDDGDDDGDDDDPLVREGDVAGDYLERLLDILDLDGDIDLDVEGERAVVAVIGGDLQHLVGPNGQVLDALQELTRLAVTTQTGGRSRLMLDIDGYREGRRTQLGELARSAADEVRTSGRPKELKAMNPFERKVVHDAVAAIDGVISESTGEEPSRRVVIQPA